MPPSLPLLKGSLDVLVLKALAWAPMHGFELTAWLTAQSGSALDLEEAAIYQALYRMEGKRLVEAEWGLSDRGKRARYYRLTTAGRAHLRREAESWRKYSKVVSAILDAVPGRP